MPASVTPIVFTLVLIALPVIGATHSRRFSIVLGCVSIIVVSSVLAYYYYPGWKLRVQAQQGDASAQYELARWEESHCEQVNSILLWPCRPNVSAGFTWLKKAADQGHPVALYACGVRLKYGYHVPKPANWDGPEGNSFPQPDVGQRMIDEAFRRGYKPTGDEKQFYFRVFRMGGTGWR